MKKILIMPGCIGCGLCQALAPYVFEVVDISRVKKDADLKKYEQQINEAIASCPMRVITYEENDEE